MDGNIPLLKPCLVCIRGTVNWELFLVFLDTNRTFKSLCLFLNNCPPLLVVNFQFVAVR